MSSGRFRIKSIFLNRQPESDALLVEDVVTGEEYGVLTVIESDEVAELSEFLMQGRIVRFVPVLDEEVDEDSDDEYDDVYGEEDPYMPQKCSDPSCWMCHPVVSEPACDCATCR